jgi:glycosyltransferase involved in cell wall biosynthesis
VEADASLLFLSRIERIKGPHTAIEIARGAGRRLVIAGNQVKEGDGPAYWRKEIEPHIDGHKVEYVGPVDDAQKSELLRRAAALVVPVEWDEPFGIVFAEALACGTPLISCPRGALPEIIEHGQHGFLINSVTDGVAAVQQLGTISRQACRARAEQQFSVQVVASEYENLYRQMISRN